MKSRAGALVVACACAWACASAPPVDVPPVTVARPPPAPTSIPLARADEPSGVGDAGSADAEPTAPRAAFVDAPQPIDGAPVCGRLIVSVVKGTMTVMGENLAVGDTLVVDAPPERVETRGTGAAVRVWLDAPCVVLGLRTPKKQVVRATAAPELKWAGGTMTAHLDVGAKAGEKLYLGRLEGTAPVAEHSHPGSFEVLAAVDAAGTFTIDGKEGRLGPKQIVVVPPGTRHAWRPDPGARLVAVQIYAPAGPEQRFLGLAAAEKIDAGAPKAH